jgi:hypothetical protein
MWLRRSPATAVLSLTGYQPRALLLLDGADEANGETLAEWSAVSTIMTGDDLVAIFEFGRNPYVFQETVGADSSVQLTGLNDASGIVLVRGAVATAAGGIFVI